MTMGNRHVRSRLSKVPRVEHQQRVEHRRGAEELSDMDNDDNSNDSKWTPGVPSRPGRPTVQLTQSGSSEKSDETLADEISLQWTPPSDDGGHAITGYRVEMLDIQSGCWIEITLLDGFETQCTLANILYGLLYRFRVIAINEAGDSDPGPPSDGIVVDAPGVQIAPYFVLGLPDNTTALANQTISFRVRVLGTPRPSVHWTLNDRDLLDALGRDNVQVARDTETDEDSFVCTVQELPVEAAGIIRCVANNAMGRAVSMGTLIVEAPPKFMSPDWSPSSSGLVFRRDDVLRLRLGFIACPSAEVTWFFEDEPIASNAEMHIDTGDTFTSLWIHSAQRWHSGLFRVEAKNPHGRDQTTILVTVTAPPSPPGQPVVVESNNSRNGAHTSHYSITTPCQLTPFLRDLLTLEYSCTLRWEPGSDDGGGEVQRYLIEYNRDTWDVWLQATTTAETSTMLTNLVLGTRYFFRVRAENDFGVSEPSISSEAVSISGSIGNTLDPAIAMWDARREAEHLHDDEEDNQEVVFDVGASPEVSTEESSYSDEEDEVSLPQMHSIATSTPLKSNRLGTSYMEAMRSASPKISINDVQTDISGDNHTSFLAQEENEYNHMYDHNKHNEHNDMYDHNEYNHNEHNDMYDHNEYGDVEQQCDMEEDHLVHSETRTSGALDNLDETKVGRMEMDSTLSSNKASRLVNLCSELVSLVPCDIPEWFVMTYIYSLVLVLIIVLSTVMGQGSLYVHFTAFWSLVLYLLLDEPNDPIESLIQGVTQQPQSHY